ncbi:MAG: nucleotide exchange factor GrpE [Clostridiaceae bacterium]
MSKEKQQKQAEPCEAEEKANNGDTGVSDTESAAADTSSNIQKELDSARSELDEKKKQCAEYLDKLQRTAADYDNFRKRTVKEKEALYIDAVCDMIGVFVPVMDNVERALQALPADGSAQCLKEGVEMVFKQFNEAVKSIGVEEIKAINEQFDPNLHNAVMHVEDDALGHNTVVEEFQKGYKYKDRVIRHSMVKVAN